MGLFDALKGITKAIPGASKLAGIAGKLPGAKAITGKLPGGDAALSFLSGLEGGGGDGEAPPIAPEPGTNDMQPWDQGNVDFTGGGGVDTGTAAPAMEPPKGLGSLEALSGGIGGPGGQSDAPSLIEELTSRNEEFAPYRNTGFTTPERPRRP